MCPPRVFTDQRTSGCERGGSQSQCSTSARAYWSRYGVRRYGAETEGGVEAWELLGRTIYGTQRGMYLGC